MIVLLMSVTPHLDPSLNLNKLSDNASIYSYSQGMINSSLVFKIPYLPPNKTGAYPHMKSCIKSYLEGIINSLSLKNETN